MLTVAIDHKEMHKVYVTCADNSCEATTKLILNVAPVTYVCMRARRGSFAKATGFCDEADEKENPICLLTTPKEQKPIFCQRVGM